VEHLLPDVIKLLVSMPAIAVTIRLSISLPATAIGRAMTLGEAWRVTRGNTLQLCGGTLLLYLPSYVFGICIGLSADKLSDSLLPLLLLIGVGALSTVAAISFVSVSYRCLAEAPGEGRTPIAGPDEAAVSPDQTLPT
jgi:hypothetical protein